MRILHIAPHLGGGVGRFLSNIIKADPNNCHEFCLLESPIDTNLLVDMSWRNFCNVQDRFDEYVAEFDVVQIEFWNHPLLFKFLMENRLPYCRLIVYAHVSGIFAPNIIPPGMFEFADTVVLSTPIAAESYANHIQKGKCRVIHEIGGISRTRTVQNIAHTGVNIAYIGTVNYAKLHPGFIQSCRALLKQVPDLRFTIASNDDNSHLRAEADEFGITDYFDFVYRTDDIETILGQADLFGYPLRADHFGTGEQSLLEAMGAGVPPVVIGNPAEKSLIQDGVTGIIANDIYDYVRAVQYCVANPEFVKNIGAQARAFALDSFSEEKTVSLFGDLYRHIMLMPKTNRQFESAFSFNNQNPGWSFFKLCLGTHDDMAGYENADSDILRQYFRDKIMRSPHLSNENKGGMRMYYKYFPDDVELRRFLMHETFRPCPVCGGQDCEKLHHQRFLLPQRHPLKDGYNVVSCAQCGFVYADTEATQADYDKFYQEQSAYQQDISVGGGATSWDAERLSETACYLDNFVHDKNARILDVGCANGGLLKAFHKLGYSNLCGIDPSSACVANTKNAGIEAYVSMITSIPHDLGRFDVVILSHVLEHVLDVDSAIQAIENIVKPNGLCYVETPNALRYAKIVKDPFQDFNTEHINHFSQISISNLFQKRAGWSIIAMGEKIISPWPDISYPACHVLFRHDESAPALSAPLRDNDLASSIKQYIDISRALLNKIEDNLSHTLNFQNDLIVWGTGQLCMKLLAETALAHANIIAFVDGNSTNWGSLLKGIPIQNPQDIKNTQIPILITSILNQAAIEDAIRTRWGLENPVFHLLDANEQR